MPYNLPPAKHKPFRPTKTSDMHTHPPSLPTTTKYPIQNAITDASGYYSQFRKTTAISGGKAQNGEEKDERE